MENFYLKTTTKGHNETKIERKPFSINKKLSKFIFPIHLQCKGSCL